MECKPSDPCYLFQGRVNIMSPRMGTITTNLQYRPEPELVKRTKAEAGVRAFNVLSKTNRLAKIPFVRPYIYALNTLTFGLIIVDPLDRLE